MALTAALCWLQGPLGGAHGGAHGGAPLTAGEERRVDITDGNAYTKAEFIAEYGGTLQWDIAKPAKEKVAPTTAAPEAPTTAAPGAPTTAAPVAPTTAASGAPTTPTLEVHWRRSRVFDRGVAAVCCQLVREAPVAALSQLDERVEIRSRPPGLNTVQLLKTCSAALGLGAHSALRIAEGLYLGAQMIATDCA